MTPDRFTDDERARLAPHFTSLDGPVFALTNLPEVVKGALFARYSRSPKSVRRLFLDEFASGETLVTQVSSIGVERAARLYKRVFDEYGDDSVAQLGGVHLACEDVSNILTKVLEWGRLMAYLEQSTRYIPYTDRPGGRWRYHVPEELNGLPALRERYVATLDHAFETYTKWLDPLQAYVTRRVSGDSIDHESVQGSSIKAKALDALRGLLPAATLANVGLYGSGQAYEALLLRLRKHPLAEARTLYGQVLKELNRVIPDFLRRVERLQSGGDEWSTYLQETRDATRAVGNRLLAGANAEDRDEVTLTDFDCEGEVKVVAAALYALSDLPDDQLLAETRKLSQQDREDVLRAYIGQRKNRRYKPGRAFERTSYRFDVLTDYGAFRDLQRHRLLTLEWQPLSPAHGYGMPKLIEEAGAASDWHAVMEESAALHDALVAAKRASIAPYALCMAYRVRFYMEMNAREAMHVLELRTSPQGHSSYRRVCQAMHRLIAQHHPAIARAMEHVDYTAVELERLQAERRTAKRRWWAGSGEGSAGNQSQAPNDEASTQGSSTQYIHFDYRPLEPPSEKTAPALFLPPAPDLHPPSSGSY